MSKSSEYARKSFKQNTTALGRILFSALARVLAFRPGVPRSNPIRILYFYRAFIPLFLCYGLQKNRKKGARLGLAKELLIAFNVQKINFVPKRLPSSINDDFKRGVLRETTPSSMAASRFKQNTSQLR